MEPAVTENTLLGGRVRLLQPARGYRIAIDAILLAAAVDAAPGDRVLDLGAGVGAVGLCLAARLPACQVVGIEFQPALVTLAERNAHLNSMADRVTTLLHDIARPLPAELGTFDHVVTNPPYLRAAVADPSPDPIKALATVESSADLARWLAAATGAAKPAGRVLIIHRSDRADEIVHLLGRLGWGDITLKALPPASRVLIQARRSFTPTQRHSPPLVLHRPDGSYTDEAEAVLRHAAPLAF
ncbi:MAG: tRNA1(Val) (adenine(37)-N6)-methyltransferase [Pseudomonadota bacterium]